MSALAIINAADDSIPRIIDHATAALTNARSAAEVLEARDLASFAYDAAKSAARLAKAKNAHDELGQALARLRAHRPPNRRASRSAPGRR